MLMFINLLLPVMLMFDAGEEGMYFPAYPAATPKVKARGSRTTPPSSTATAASASRAGPSTTTTTTPPAVAPAPAAPTPETLGKIHF